MISFKLFPLIFLSFIVFQLNAQDSLRTWKRGGASNLNIAQVGLKNWVGGGQNSFSVTALQNLYLNRSTPKLKWNTQLDLGFGLLRQGVDKKFYKSEDKLIFISKLSRSLTEHLFFSGLVDFRSQIAPGHNFSIDSTGTQQRTLISRFLAPGYLVVSPGFEYKFKEFIYIFLSPVSGKFTFVANEALSNAGAFGVEPGNKIRKEFGAYFNAGLKKRLVENVNLDTKISLFSNYETFGNIDVNWELTLLMKVNKYISTSISSQLIYDEDIEVKREDETVGAAVQFKEVINVGLIYQFAK